MLDISNWPLTLKPQFILLICNLGNDDLLKAEVSLHYPSLRLSFSRPGLISYKNSAASLSWSDLTELENKLSFCKRAMFFNSKSKGLAEQSELRVNLQKSFETLSVHTMDLSTLKVSSTGDLKKGNFVLDEIQIGEDEWWNGLHCHHPSLSHFPFSTPTLELPLEAPSRAWLKMAETNLRFSFFSKDDRIFELGSAPGGVSFFLLSQGLQVLALDPGEMHEVCQSFKGFQHLKIPVQECPPRAVKAFKPQWIAVDMNLPSDFSINESIRMAELARRDLLGIILTIKMPKPQLVHKLAVWKKKLDSLGMIESRYVQLASHKREILYVGLTELGIKRGCGL